MTSHIAPRSEYLVLLFDGGGNLALLKGFNTI